VKVIVDTCVWSRALRRNETGSNGLAGELAELITEGRAQLIGPIRQELLSGIKTKSQFNRLKKHLAAFFELAAEFFNLARGKGIHGSNTDFLICALAHRHNLPIFTCDQDFDLYATVLPIRLYKPGLAA
jgi:hypothetical protein